MAATFELKTKKSLIVQAYSDILVPSFLTLVAGNGKSSEDLKSPYSKTKRST